MSYSDIDPKVVSFACILLRDMRAQFDAHAEVGVTLRANCVVAEVVVRMSSGLACMTHDVGFREIVTEPMSSQWLACATIETMKRRMSAEPT